VSLSGIFTLVAWLLDLLVLIILVRIILSWIPGLNPFNPFVVVVRRIADPILAPFRGVLPSLGGMLDLSPILAIIVLGALAQVFFSLGANVGIVPVGCIAANAVQQLINTVVIIVIVLVGLRLLVSLFHADPWHPLTRGVQAISAPFCRPFEGMVGRSSVDVAAIVALAVYIVVYIVIQVIFNNVIDPATCVISLP
jgi:YggT family protein